MSFDAWSLQFYRQGAEEPSTPADVLARELKGTDARSPDRQPRHPPAGILQAALRLHQGRGHRRPRRHRPAQARRGPRGLGAIEDSASACPGRSCWGIWAMESGFGAIQGDYDVVRSMATLAAQEPRRRAFAETELIAALRIIASGGRAAPAPSSRDPGPRSHVDRIIPSSVRTSPPPWTAAGDGQARHLGLQRRCAGLPAANLPGQGRLGGRARAGRAKVAVPPDFDFSLSRRPEGDPRTGWAQEWGSGRADKVCPGRPADQAAEAQLVAPTGAVGAGLPAVPQPLRVFGKYNNSCWPMPWAWASWPTRFRGRGGQAGAPLARRDAPLSLVDRMTAQRRPHGARLQPNGVPDGVVGMGTRAALRAWQKSAGLTADGYLSMDHGATAVGGDHKRPPPFGRGPQLQIDQALLTPH